jgi:hypothetical protein
MMGLRRREEVRGFYKTSQPAGPVKYRGAGLRHQSAKALCPIDDKPKESGLALRSSSNTSPDSRL